MLGRADRVGGVDRGRRRGSRNKSASWATELVDRLAPRRLRPSSGQHERVEIAPLAIVLLRFAERVERGQRGSPVLSGEGDPHAPFARRRRSARPVARTARRSSADSSKSVAWNSASAFSIAALLLLARARSAVPAWTTPYRLRWIACAPCAAGPASRPADGAACRATCEAARKCPGGIVQRLGDALRGDRVLRWQATAPAMPPCRPCQHRPPSGCATTGARVSAGPGRARRRSPDRRRSAGSPSSTGPQGRGQTPAVRCARASPAMRNNSASRRDRAGTSR